MTEQRTLPQNIEAEQCVLAAMLLGDLRCIDEMVNFLQTADFYRVAHQVIFAHMLQLHRVNTPIDTITLIDSLRNSQKLADVGGVAYITSLATAVPTTANARYHAEIVKNKARLRLMIEAGTEIVTMGYEPETDNVQELMDRAETKIMHIAQNANAASFTSIDSVLTANMDKLSQLSGKKGGMLGLPTGIADFDSMTSGLQGSDFIILAARPSMGKTALALNMVTEVALRGHKKIGGNPLCVAFFSLEMSKEQLVNRILCSEARIDSSRLRIGELTDQEWDKLWKYASLLSESKIYIDDTGGITSMELRSRARRLKAEQGLDLIVIDYLQLMQGSGKSRNEENRQTEVSEISRSLKALARELNVPVIALSQLSRAVEARTSKKPMLSDLRESGSLEQDADIVCFLYREAYYNPEAENPHNTELIIAKHRNGATGTVNLYFENEFTHFRDMSQRQEGK